MTWPFENDTSAVVKRISNRSISANRKRNLFTIITIALASALLLAIMLYGFGTSQSSKHIKFSTKVFILQSIGKLSINLIVEGARDYKKFIILK